MTEERNIFKSIVRFLANNALLFLTLCGVAFGFIVGFAIRQYDLSDSAILWMGLPGEMYMRMLMMTILPLIVASVIAGAASLEPRANGRIGGLGFTYTLINNTFGVLLGLTVSYILKPGSDVIVKETTQDEPKEVLLTTEDIFADMIRNIFPDNLVTACFQKAQTSYRKEEKIKEINGTNITMVDYERFLGQSNSTNVLGLIVVCSLIGMATSKLGEKGRPFLLFFQATSDVIIAVLRWLVWFTPIGVASLIMHSVALVPDLTAVITSVGIFVGAMALITGLIDFVFIPLTYFIFIRKNPLVFLYTALRPVFVAFAPPSTAIAMPELFYATESKHGVDKRVSRFTVPFGAALNRVGSAAFIVLSTQFLSRLEGVDLHAGNVVFLSLLILVASFAIPSIPSGSIVTIIIVLASIDVTPGHIGLLMALEWLTDRMRSTCNCMSTMLGTIVVNKLCERTLAELDRDHGKEQDDDGQVDGKQEDKEDGDITISAL